jgi:hypothetical protein
MTTHRLMKREVSVPQDTLFDPEPYIWGLYYGPSNCLDCGEHACIYMVDDDIWEHAVPENVYAVNVFLCLPCLTARVGRPLTRDDFPAHIPANDWIHNAGHDRQGET